MRGIPAPAPNYDLEAEHARLSFADAHRGGVTLNRGTAHAEPGVENPPEFDAVRAAHEAAIAPTTLPAGAPVVELDRPTTGIYVGSRRGVYLDLYQGVAQRLFSDEQILPKMQPLIDSGLLLRREINTDDLIGCAPDGVVTPVELAELVTGMAGKELPRADGYRVFFSNSGTEAVEAALKAVTRHAYVRFLERHGEDAWAKVCAELGIPRVTVGADKTWADFPLFLIGLQGAFHGRTLGSLQLTRSRAIHREGFPAWRWSRHVSPRDPADAEALIDWTPVDEVLATPGELRQVVDSGRVPAGLLAGAIIEPMQGEGGYRMPADAVLDALRRACDRAGGLLIADEVQTFARTGAPFLSSLRGIRADVVCLAKAAVLGMTLLPAEVAEGLPNGWHANTFGSGKLFDVNYAYHVIDTFLNGRDPVLAGLSFAENERVKGAHLRERLDELATAHPEAIGEFEGAGCMWGFTVPDRAAFVAEAWRQGAKMLGAGEAEAPGRMRIILPADVLVREVDEVIAVLGRTLDGLAAR